MPIPAGTSSDILLWSILTKQVDNFDKWIKVEELTRTVQGSDNPGQDVQGLKKDVTYLKNHCLVESRADNSEVRLTPLGVYTALLFEAPDRTKIGR